MLGLLISGIFGATMSNMTPVNKNAPLLCEEFYQGPHRRRARKRNVGRQQIVTFCWASW